MPKLFISYSQDSKEHSQRIRALADRLVQDLQAASYEINLDQYVRDPDLPWSAWCEKQVRDADRVLIVFTATYRRRYDGEETPGKGLGATYEAELIREQIYKAGLTNRKFRAVIFDATDRQFIPDRLSGHNVYRPLETDSYSNLVEWLCGAFQAAQPASQPLPIKWPPPADDFLPDLANRKPEFAHFKQVLAGKSSERILLLGGPTNSGKTALMGALYAYCQRASVPASRVDLKGCPMLENIFSALEFDLREQLLPRFCAASGSDRTFKLLADLEQLRQPVVLAFDTYQDSSDLVQKWVEGQLLPRLDRTPAVIVVICGQKLPDAVKHPWKSMAKQMELPAITEVDDWLDYIRRTVQPANLKREHVETLTTIYSGNPGQVSAMIQTLAKQLKPGPKTDRQ